MKPIEQSSSSRQRREGLVSAAIPALAPLEGKALRKGTFKEMLMKASAFMEDDEGLPGHENIRESGDRSGWKIDQTGARPDTFWFPL